jgi:alkyl sulfatase BDS1-like metallo-beta-lactamase superfamily hydrolase
MSVDDIVWPTITFEDHYTFSLGGRRFELSHTTGETGDHLMVWLPPEKVLFCGDLYYFSFPNLSTPMLRPRPVAGWYPLPRASSQRCNPNCSFRGISRRWRATREATDALDRHARAIRSIYDQTLACINAGTPVEQAVQQVRLPAELAGRPQLREVYGRVDWSVRGIYQREARMV